MINWSQYKSINIWSVADVSIVSKGGSELPPYNTSPSYCIQPPPPANTCYSTSKCSYSSDLLHAVNSHFGVDSPIWYNPTRRCFMVIFFILCFIELPIDESWTILRLESNIITIDNEIDTQLAACYQIFIDLFYILQVGTFIKFPKSVYIALFLRFPVSSGYFA